MNIANMITGIQIVLALLLFIGLLYFGMHISRPQMILRTYEAICAKAKNEKCSWWDYEKWDDFLTENGAVFHYGKWMNPVSYIALCIVVCIGGFVIGTWYNWGIGCLAATTGAFLPGILLEYLNRRDNEQMMSELDLVYSALAIQVRAGVFVSDALTECYNSVRFPRLRIGLQDLCSDIVMQSDMGRALEKFQKKFNNKYIDTLCITILQACESGQAVELLGDIAEQIKDMELLLQQRRKERLDRSVTFYQLGIFTIALSLTLYLCIRNMVSASLFFGK